MPFQLKVNIRYQKDLLFLGDSLKFAVVINHRLVI